MSHVPVRATVIALAVFATLAATACGGGSSQGSTSSGGSASVADVSYAQGQITANSSVPPFTFTSPSFNPASLKGKYVFNVPVISSVPFVQDIDTAQKQVADRLGLRYTSFTNQGTVQEWAQGITEGVTQKADVINLLGSMDLNALQPQLQQAKAAGIPVVYSHGIDLSQTPPFPVNALVSGDYRRAGRLMADWIIADTKGHGSIALVESTDLPPTAALVAAFTDELKSHCGSGCNLKKVINVPSAQWATKIQSAVQSELLADPSINYLVPIYDGMCQYAVPAVTIAGREGKVHITAFNGSPFALDFLRTGDIVRMDVGENATWDGWANMDQVMRVLLGMQPVGNEAEGMRVWTQNNASEAGVPAKPNVGYGDAYVTGYNKLWQQSG